jgi:hypothetical protein
MAAAHSDDAVWQVVKRHNAFVRKGLNGAVFSAEPYNLYNLHNKRYSGTARLVSVSSPGSSYPRSAWQLHRARKQPRDRRPTRHGEGDEAWHPPQEQAQPTEARKRPVRYKAPQQAPAQGCCARSAIRAPGPCRRSCASRKRRAQGYAQPDGCSEGRGGMIGVQSAVQL